MEIRNIVNKDRPYVHLICIFLPRLYLFSDWRSPLSPNPWPAGSLCMKFMIAPATGANDPKFKILQAQSSSHLHNHKITNIHSL